MGATNFYDPNQVQFSVGGKVISGFMSGSMIEVEPAAELFNNVVGTQGDVGIATVYNDLVTIKCKLMQTSSSNDDLNAIVVASRTSTASSVAAACSLADMSGTTRVAGKAWVQKRPTVVFSDTIEGREWTITCNASTFTVGGNSAVS